MEKSMYDVRFEDVTEGLTLIKMSEYELKDQGAEFVGYTEEYYEPEMTGFYSYRIYEFEGEKFITTDGWRFRNQ